MSDGIEGNSFFSVKLEPWHKKGAILENAPTSEEAIKQAGLDWKVVKKQLFIAGEAPADLLGPVRYLPISGRQALIRDKDQSLLSVVSDEYTPLQNAEAFSIFDPFVKDGTLSYETAGSLVSGKKVFILAKWNAGGQFKLFGQDEIRPYLLLASGHDGASGVLVQPTPIRVVCQNTLASSIESGYVINFRHVGDLKTKVTDAVEALAAMERRFTELSETYSRFVQTPLTPEAAWALTNNLLFPSNGDKGVAALPPEEEWEDNEVIPRWQLTLHAQRGKILELYERGLGSDFTTAKGTLWGWYNAVVEFVDWYAGKRARDRTNYVLFGDGRDLKEKAFTIACGCFELVDA